MYVTKEKIIIILYILLSICIVLAIGFLLTGKVPEELFKDSKEEKKEDSKEDKKEDSKEDKKEGYENTNTKYAKKTIETNNNDPTILNENDVNVKNYNSNNYDVQYHDDVVKINQEKETPFLGTFMAKDNNNNIIGVPYTPSFTLPTYYKPGSNIFSSTNYVPNYEDSVYLSRTTGLSTLGKAYPTSKMAGGFCSYYENDQIKLEQLCNEVDNTTCSSVSCCVLLGGNKCVSGNKEGPTMKANYTDPTVINKDVYYYQGKCYGNCL